MEKPEMMLDVQYLDSKYSTYYFVPWPDCQFFDEMDEDDDHVIPVWRQSLLGSFVDAEWIANGCKDD